VARTVLPSLFCPDQTPLDVCLWGFDEKRSLQKKSGYTGRTGHPHIGCCCPHKKIAKINSDEQRVIFARELQSALQRKQVVRTFNVNCDKFVI